MATIEREIIQRREIPLKIWISLKGLEPHVDFVIDNHGHRELVFAIDEKVLQSITRVEDTNNIAHNERILIDYVLHQMKPAIATIYCERSYDPVRSVIYEYYKEMLERVGI